MKAKEYDLRIREISDSLKRNNIRIIGVPEEEEREIGVEGFCERIIAENFPNLGKVTDIKFRKHRGPPLDSTKPAINKAYHSQIHKRLRPGETYECSKGKKSLTYKGRQIRFAADLSTETWQARKSGRIYTMY